LKPSRTRQDLPHQSREKSREMSFEACPFCGREIPINNMALHHLRCSPKISQNQIESWSCSQCTFLNHNSSNKCELCDFEKNTHVSHVHPEKSVRYDEWQCPRCTYLNMSGIVCSVCESSRQLTVDLSDEVSLVSPPNFANSFIPRKAPRDDSSHAPPAPPPSSRLKSESDRRYHSAPRRRADAASNPQPAIAPRSSRPAPSSHIRDRSNPRSTQRAPVILSSNSTPQSSSSRPARRSSTPPRLTSNYRERQRQRRSSPPRSLPSYVSDFDATLSMLGASVEYMIASEMSRLADRNEGRDEVELDFNDYDAMLERCVSDPHILLYIL
jgi:hypothetical protein